MKKTTLIITALTAALSAFANGYVTSEFTTDNPLIPSTYFHPADRWNANVWVVNTGKDYTEGEWFDKYDYYNHVWGEPATDANGRKWYEPDYELTSGPAFEESGVRGNIAWKSGTSPFNSLVPRDVTGEIYLRRTFSIDEVPQAPVNLAFGWVNSLSEWYINGKLVMNVEEGPVWDPYWPIPDNSVLKEGENVIAVHIHQNWGQVTADCGLYPENQKLHILSTYHYGSWPCKYKLLNSNNEINGEIAGGCFNVNADLSAWNEGHGPFENGGDLTFTYWDSKKHPLLVSRNIFLDTSSEKALKNGANLYLIISYDQNPVVYLNGTEIWRRDGWNDNNYEIYKLTKAQASLLVRGDNSLAVSLESGEGGGHIDYGLYLDLPCEGYEFIEPWNLEPYQKVLQDLIDEAGSLQQTPAVQQAIAQGQSALANATTSAELNRAITALQDVINNSELITFIECKSVSLTGSSIEGGVDLEMRKVSPTRFVSFLRLDPGQYSFKGVAENGSSFLIGSGSNGSPVVNGMPFDVDAPRIVRIALEMKNDAYGLSVTDLTSLNLMGSVIPDNTTLSYAGNGVWKSEVVLDKSTPTNVDYPARNFYFRFNNDENLAVRRHRFTSDVDMPIDGITDIENIRINQGVYDITLDMRNFKFEVNAEIDPLRVSVFGSSVANGQGAGEMRGYAYLYGEQLKQRYADGLSPNAFFTSGISIGGNTTNDLHNRYDDMLRDFSKFVVIGLSLGNEGIHETSNQQAVFNQFRDNMLSLISKMRADGKFPVVVNNYTRSDYNDSDYGYVKQMNMLIHSWDVPSVNSLGSIDDGAGHWAAGYIADNGHPNTAGHEEFMHGFVPSLFDALIDGKPLPVRDSSKELTLDNGTLVRFTPEGTLHSFTVNVRMKAYEPGVILQYGKCVLSINEDGTVKYSGLQPRSAFSTSVAIADGEWHDVALSHYYARSYTALYIDGKLAGSVGEKINLDNEFVLGDTSSSRTIAEIAFWRAGMNDLEMNAWHDGDMLKSSLEIYSPMEVQSDGSIANSAQSTNSLVYDKSSSLGKLPSGECPFRVEPSIGYALFYGDDDTPVGIYTVEGRLVSTVIPSSYGKKAVLSRGFYIAANTPFFIK